MTPAKSIDDTRPRRHLRGRCYTIALQSLPLESPSPPSVSCAGSSPGRGAMLVQVSLVCFPQRGKWRAARADRGSLPLEGKGDRLRWMRWMYLPLISRLSATAFHPSLCRLRRHLPPSEGVFSRGRSLFYSLCPTVGEGLAPPALQTLPYQRKFKPPSDEGGGKTAGFDGGREKRPIVESPNFPPPPAGHLAGRGEALSSPGR